MNTLITADFHGTQVIFQNDAYLNANRIAQKFGKRPKEYLRTDRTQDYINALVKHIDSKGLKSPLEENQLVRVNHGGNNRGTWLHPKLAIDFARWLSAEFAVWCDEQIENILNNNQVHNISTTTSRIPLKDAVNMAVAKTGMIYSDCYKMIHQRFGVESVAELTDEQLPQAIEYVHKVLSGEVMPKRKIRSRDDLSFTKRDSEGRLLNWVVPYRNDNWHEGYYIGQMWFKEVAELIKHNPQKGYEAVMYSAQAALKLEKGGHLSGFTDSLAQWATTGVLSGDITTRIKTQKMAEPPKRGINQLIDQEQWC